jgi:hypothetical protein
MEAIFQFFYSSKETGLPHQDMPTRDVTNSQRQDYKTEPNLERLMENWCSCRARSVSKAAKCGQDLATKGEQHYLVLTTKHPETGKAFAVGVMPFSQKNFSAALKKYKKRWDKRLPYVSDENLKICSFPNSFPLKMKKSKDGSEHVPGSRYAPVLVRSEKLLVKIINHFKLKKSGIKEFLQNVRFLEKRLAKENPSGYEKYVSRNQVGNHCCV